MAQSKKRSNCPISCTLDILGDKWSLLIIRDLMLTQGCTYGDFLRSAEGISTNILASRLLSLEANHLIEKREYPGSKVKVMYRLTEMGISLLPLIIEIHLWFDTYFTIPEESRAMMSLLKKDKEAFLQSTMSELRKHIHTA